MKKNILEISAGILHPNLIARGVVRRIFSELEEYSIDSQTGIESALKLESGDYAAAIIFLHRKTISPKALDALKKFVSQGGGLLALHSATASFKTEPDYFELIGGRFRSHGKIEGFSVRPEPASESIFGQMESFTIRDELYLHELHDDIKIMFSAEFQGKSEPIAWIRNYNQGRVFYYCPGHCASSLKNLSSRQILRRGMEWVCRTQ